LFIVAKHLQAVLAFLQALAVVFQDPISCKLGCLFVLSNQDICSDTQIMHTGLSRSGVAKGNAVGGRELGLMILMLCWGRSQTLMNLLRPFEDAGWLMTAWKPILDSWKIHLAFFNNACWMKSGGVIR
jgi:hypothetical protein